ncbi:MAG: SDR family oxidoreductase [Bacteroidales bacterium]|nr:SDR family oxidoreductase [Bacteroidales bacterium]
MDKFYKNKVAVVTGASSGIGKAIAFELARRGTKVVLSARREDKLQDVVQTIRDNGGEAIYDVMDVTVEEECKKLIDKTINQYGKLDILVCNAGISMRANFKDVNMDVLHRLMDVNFWGTVYCAKYALPYLIESKGSLVGLSSIAGIHGLPGRTAYSASKFAVTGFLETIRIENLKNNLHVMIAVPGFTATDIRFRALIADGSEQGGTPRNEEKMMTAEKVAKRVADGIQGRKRLLVLDTSGRIIVLLKKFFNKSLDKIFYKAMAKEPDSPLTQQT